MEEKQEIITPVFTSGSTPAGFPHPYQSQRGLPAFVMTEEQFQRAMARAQQ